MRNLTGKQNPLKYTLFSAHQKEWKRPVGRPLIRLSIITNGEQNDVVDFNRISYQDNENNQETPNPICWSGRRSHHIKEYWKKYRDWKIRKKGYQSKNGSRNNKHRDYISNFSRSTKIYPPLLLKNAPVFIQMTLKLIDLVFVLYFPLEHLYKNKEFHNYKERNTAKQIVIF